MDPNAHDRPPATDVVEVEADFSDLVRSFVTAGWSRADHGSRSQKNAVPQPPMDAPLSSSIFRSIRPPPSDIGQPSPDS